jgi:hypothetical protein
MSIFYSEGGAMYNQITLVGTMTEHPKEMFDPTGKQAAIISLQVSLPPDAQPTYWGLVYDLRSPDWPTGSDIFLVICREPLLIEKCLRSLQKGDVICVEGCLVLTLLRSHEDLVPLAEILASNIVLITKAASK